MSLEFEKVLSRTGLLLQVVKVKLPPPLPATAANTQAPILGAEEAITRLCWALLMPVIFTVPRSFRHLGEAGVLVPILQMTKVKPREGEGWVRSSLVAKWDM